MVVFVVVGGRMLRGIMTELELATLSLGPERTDVDEVLFLTFFVLVDLFSRSVVAENRDSFHSTVKPSAKVCFRPEPRAFLTTS